MQDILKNFPPSSQNNSRYIVKSLIKRMIDKPSYGTEVQLRKLGIGVQWTHEYGEDSPQVEDIYIADRERCNITDEELMKLI